jgi:hypothetical protein
MTGRRSHALISSARPLYKPVLVVSRCKPRNIAITFSEQTRGQFGSPRTRHQQIVGALMGVQRVVRLTMDSSRSRHNTPTPQPTLAKQALSNSTQVSSSSSGSASASSTLQNKRSVCSRSGWDRNPLPGPITSTRGRYFK